MMRAANQKGLEIDAGAGDVLEDAPGLGPAGEVVLEDQSGLPASEVFRFHGPTAAQGEERKQEDKARKPLHASPLSLRFARASRRLRTMSWRRADRGWLQIIAIAHALSTVGTQA